MIWASMTVQVLFLLLDAWSYYGSWGLFIPSVYFLEMGVIHADLTFMVLLSLPLKCYHLGVFRHS